MAGVVGIDGDRASVALSIGGRTVVRRAFCSRLTLYTELGNFSMVGTRYDPAFKGSVLALWKDHRSERILSDADVDVRNVLIATLRTLCPRQYGDRFSALAPR